jgi:hypothetical protein
MHNAGREHRHEHKKCLRLRWNERDRGTDVSQNSNSKTSECWEVTFLSRHVSSFNNIPHFVIHCYSFHLMPSRTLEQKDRFNSLLGMPERRSLVAACVLCHIEHQAWCSRSCLSEGDQERWNAIFAPFLLIWKRRPAAIAHCRCVIQTSPFMHSSPWQWACYIHYTAQGL